jgi:hypothetical protein
MNVGWKFIAYGIFLAIVSVVALTPKRAAHKFMVDFDDCRGLSAAAIITAAIAGAYALRGRLLEFVISPEMMVVATTVAFEVAYAYCFDRVASKRAKAYIILISAIVVLLGAWRTYTAIMQEGAISDEHVSGGFLLLQAVIWIAAFVVAFSAKVYAARAKEKGQKLHTQPANLPEVCKTKA